MMKPSRAPFVVAALSLMLSAASAHEEQPGAESVTPRLHTAIPNLTRPQFVSAIVTFPPRAKSAPHRHGEAFVYAYVLSGSVRSQIDDEPARVYRAGQEWTEAPGAHHKVTENTSSTRPARLLIVFVAPDGAPLKIPD